MKRGEWTFEYIGSAVAEAAKKKLAYHTERLEAWRVTKAEVVLKIQREGLLLSESQADSMGSNSGRMRPQVLVRVDLQRNLDECHDKIVEHRARVQEYGNWVTVLEAHPDTALLLTADDYLFFYGYAAASDAGEAGGNG